jgi:SAM-dependent methyltransferase
MSTQPAPPEKFIASEAGYYEEGSIWHPSRYSRADEQLRYERAADLVPADVESLLDVGCGNGAFLEYLEAHRHKDMRLRGVERSAAAISAAICRSPIDTGSIHELPYPDRSFGAVAGLEVLEHLPEPIYKASLRELSRVAGQYVLISVPYRERRRRVTCPVCSCRFQPSYHMRSFSESTFATLVPDFRIDTLVVLSVKDYLGAGLLRSAYRLLARGDDMPPGSLCPQCGHRQPRDRAISPLLVARMALRQRFKERLPRSHRRKW